MSLNSIFSSPESILINICTILHIHYIFTETVRQYLMHVFFKVIQILGQNMLKVMFMEHSYNFLNLRNL